MNRTRRHIDRRALFASGAAAALLAATGVVAGPSPTRGGRLRLALSGAARTDGFDARQPQGLFMQVAMAGMVFDTLTEIGADGALRGELATGWHGQAGGRIWTFDLRTGVRFHNKTVLSARDVVVSLSRHMAGMLGNMARIDRLTDAQVQITLHRPQPDFPYLLSAPNLVIGPADHPGAGIGTGLYRVHRFLPGRQVIGHRVHDHYKDGTAGWFDSVELVSIPSADVRAEALRAGLVDVADITDAATMQGMADVILLPDAQAVSTVARTDVRMPATVGARAPLDNLRAPERWWMG